MASLMQYRLVSPCSGSVRAEKRYTPTHGPYILKSKLQKHRAAAVSFRRLSFLDDTLYAMSSILSVLGQLASWKMIYCCSWTLHLMPKFKKKRRSRREPSEAFIFEWRAICNVLFSLRARSECEREKDIHLLVGSCALHFEA
jgi:hypothetical protein